MNVEASEGISFRLQAAIYRESVALVEAGVCDAGDVDRVITNSIGRRWSVGGPFEIWEQIGWDLVQVIAGELVSESACLFKPPTNIRRHSLSAPFAALCTAFSTGTRRLRVCS